MNQVAHIRKNNVIDSFLYIFSHLVSINGLLMPNDYKYTKNTNYQCCFFLMQDRGILAIVCSTVHGIDDSPPTIGNIGPSLLFWKDKPGMPQ